MAAKTPKTAKTKPPPAADSVAPKRVKTDWEAVERDYRTGKYTLRELQTKHGADNGLIARKAKKAGWTQDLAIAIKQATNAKLAEQLVSTEVSNSQQKVSSTIEAAATMGANVILGHRTGLKRLAEVQRKLLEQIEQAVDNMPDLSEIIELVRKPNENGVDRANDALRKAMDRSTLSDDLKKLADVNEKVRKGEREAFSLDDKPEDDNHGDGRTMSDAELAVRLDHLFSKVQK